MEPAAERGDAVADTHLPSSVPTATNTCLRRELTANSRPCKARVKSAP